MPQYYLGKGDDFFDALNANPPFSLFFSEVFGEQGDDTIIVSDFYGVLIDGGKGEDTLIIDSAGINTVVGGAGDDALTFTGNGSIINGGNGDDEITVHTSHVFGTSGGNIITGGRGEDSFHLTTEPTHPPLARVRVSNDPPTGIVNLLDDGDIIIGTIDQITDYTAGELLDIGGTSALSTVELLPYNRFSFPPGIGNDMELMLEDGEYAFIRGDLTFFNFQVNSETGTDLLIVYNSIDAVGFIGAVALLEFTNADLVLIG